METPSYIIAEFRNPELLCLLVPVFFLFLWRLWKFFHQGVTFPRQIFLWDHFRISGEEGRKLKRNLSLSDFLREIFPYIRYLALGLLVIAASGPGTKKYFLPDEKMGIDIMIALDISGSMVKSRDFLPRTRLDVSKSLLEDFIDKRDTDRLGLVVFAGASYLQSPLTYDRTTLKEILREIHTDTIQEQGTAIGDAILLSTYRLKSEYTKTKIILLMTDGASNTGRIDPETAAFTAKAFGIKIYSIGIGKDDGEYEVNFRGLEEISHQTGGKFFQAETPEELKDVLDTLDSLEKDMLADKPREILESDYRDFLVLAILLLVVDWGGRAFVYRYYA